MKKVVISIPVHEQPLVVKNHLSNIQKFVPNSAVVLHASGDHPNFRNEIVNLCNKFDGFAYVNSISYPTHSPNDAGFVKGLSTVHASNFRFISSILEFDTFVFETSNDMFVRKGVENLINSYDCGVPAQKADVNETYANVIMFRSIIDTLKKVCSLKTIEKAAQEGSWYPYHVFKEVSNLILNNFQNEMLSAEEVVLHTLSFNLFPELYDSNAGDSYVFHRWQDYATKNVDILDVRNGLYPNKYVVKRVPRRIDDPCRQFVNKLTMND